MRLLATTHCCEHYFIATTIATTIAPSPLITSGDSTVYRSLTSGECATRSTRERWACRPPTVVRRVGRTRPLRTYGLVP